ncbi:hypothetical protein ACFV1Q_02565, partial [Streptomyces sp. NPDC059604]
MRPVRILLAAAALLALTACSAEEDVTKPAPKETAAERAAGIPSAPTGGGRRAPPGLGGRARPHTPHGEVWGGERARAP